MFKIVIFDYELVSKQAVVKIAIRDMFIGCISKKLTLNKRAFLKIGIIYATFFKYASVENGSCSS